MNPNKMSAFACILSLFSFSAIAADYPMSGQDVTYHAAARASELSLNTRSSAALQLMDGHAYRLRFSSASSDFTIMPGDGTGTSFHVDGGFPNGNLRNFTIDGSKFGNPGMTMSAYTGNRQIGHTDPAQMTQGCQINCGTHVVCHMTPVHTVCTGRAPDRWCETTGGDEICNNEITWCAGTQDVIASTITTADVYEVAYADSASGAKLGSFYSQANVQTALNVSQVLNSCH